MPLAGLLLACAMGCEGVPQPPEAVLSGRVYRADTHAPVAGALVTLLPSLYSASADSEGRYEFSSFQGQAVSAVRVSATGYITRELGFTPGRSVLNVGLVYVGAGTVSGIVTDAEGRPVAGAAVTVSGQGLDATTDAGGLYRLLDVPGGLRTLAASHDGYRTLELSVDVPDGGEAVLNFQLDREPTTPAFSLSLWERAGVRAH